MAKSPARMAEDTPNWAESNEAPRSPAIRTWIVGAPRRVSLWSITSSWIRANVWNSSMEAATRATAASSAPLPARYPSQQNIGRSRFPPARTIRRTSSKSGRNDGWPASIDARSSSRNSMRVRSISDRIPARAGGSATAPSGSGIDPEYPRAPLSRRSPVVLHSPRRDAAWPVPEALHRRHRRHLRVDRGGGTGPGHRIRRGLSQLARLRAGTDPAAPPVPRADRVQPPAAGHDRRDPGGPGAPGGDPVVPASS